MGCPLYGKKNHHNINEWTLQLLNIQENDRILEIGTGRGITLSKVAEKNLTAEKYMEWMPLVI
ncbi:hypothetical protein BsIDN1_46900 [Bacillus safensis]|uniref:Uncharacterized protein n=1 Tax=Bacillus safensis TaxID=561879 RepID=A0A5S9MEM8_BACIA|nr:hypothetical protein BsIDN1_46900 [Bacillus safensis]